MPDALQQTLAAFAKLSGADRLAILRQLSPEERAALTKLAAPQTKPKAGASSTKTPAPACSPWLAKRVAELLEDRDGATITEAARTALRDVLSEPAR